MQVRSMKDNFGDKDAATPSTAVQMSGLNMVPIAGDDFIVAKTLDEVCCWLLVIHWLRNMLLHCQGHERFTGW